MATKATQQKRVSTPRPQRVANLIGKCTSDQIEEIAKILVQHKRGAAHLLVASIQAESVARALRGNADDLMVPATASEHVLSIGDVKVPVRLDPKGV